MSVINGFKFNKGLGQNFILDERYLESIVGEINICDSDTVVEVGTGAGTLTRVLARKACRVITYEVDKRLESTLVAQFNGFNNIVLKFEDGLRACDLDLWSDRYIVVANIPYYITSPLIMKFMSDPKCVRICVLVQKEVAERIVAKQGSKDYGALSVALQSSAVCKIIKFVPRKLFTPVPDVDSAFVVIDKKVESGKVPDAVAFERLLKGLFGARRKTVLNGLGIVLGVSKDKVLEILGDAGIDARLRPEQISVDKFIELSKIIEQKIK